MLDWTESALVALYFATGEARWRPRNPKPKCDAVVWVMNPRSFNHRYGFGEDRIPSFEDPAVKPYLDNYFNPPKPVTWPDKPMAFEPPHNSLRLAAQRGKFTIHGKSRKSLNVFSDDEDVLVKIVIRGKERDWVRQQLGRAGITEGTLYPGLEGLSRDIDDYLADAIVP